jgi:hypothetical protein
MSEIRVQRYDVHDFVLESATAHDDPFAVSLSATFESDAGDAIENVAGFYDGADDGELAGASAAAAGAPAAASRDSPSPHGGRPRWIVRFCPLYEGLWRGRTTSDDPALDGLELPPVRCTPNENPRVHGRPQIAPRQWRRFAFDDGAACVPLGFECDWLFSLHQSRPDDFRQAADLLAERGFNHVVTNLYAHTGFADASNEWVFAPPRLYVFGGSNERPDHARLNVAFFRDFDAMMRELHDRGITCHLMIQVQNKHVAWPARRSAEDQRFWRYVVSRYQAFPNLVWNVGKESFYFVKELGGHDYTIERIRLIRGLDAYKHLITVHDSAVGSAGRTSPADDLCDFVCDQVHLGDTDAYNREAVRRFRTESKPYMNIEYGYEEGVEALKSYRGRTTAPWQDVLNWTWAICLGGGYPCYYYTNTAWDLVKFQPEPPGWRRYRTLADCLAAVDLTAMVPDNDYVARGFCLVEPGRQYLAFLPEGGDLEIELSAMSPRARPQCTWLDAHTGERREIAVEPAGFTTRIGNPLGERGHPCAVTITTVEG